MFISQIFAILFAMQLLTPTPPPASVHDFTMKNIMGEDVKLSQYKGKVLLIVNVASKCGLTPQYKDLQALYDEMGSEGLEILAFPANDFMGQEPGSDSEIKQFCATKYAITFPLFSKISVKGKDIDPLYAFLTQKSQNGVLDAPVTWNFQKFLVDREGKLIAAFEPKESVTSESVRKKIKDTLAGKAKADSAKSKRTKKAKK